MLLLPVNASADVLERLQQQPVTLFAQGLDLAGKYVNEVVTQKKFNKYNKKLWPYVEVSGGAVYVPKDDTINLTVNAEVNRTLDKKTHRFIPDFILTHEKCEQSVRFLQVSLYKSKGFIDPFQGNKRAGDFLSNMRVASWFSNDRNISDRNNLSLGAEIIKKMKVRLIINAGDFFMDCTMPFSGGDITVTKMEYKGESGNNR